MARRKRKTENEVKGLIGQNITSSIGWLGGEVAGERGRSLDYYNGHLLGVDDEADEEGRSTYVSMDVQDAVESAMPDFMEVFASSTDTFGFEPEEPSDEEFCEQASDYINMVYWRDNPGYELTHDWIKTGAIQKNGFMGCWWDDTANIKQETLTGVNSVAMAEYLELEKRGIDQPGGVKILEASVERPANPEELPYYPDGNVYAVRLKRNAGGRVKIKGIMPERFLFSRFAEDLGPKVLFVAHYEDVPRSDLIEEGYSEDLVMKLPSQDQHYPRATRESFARWRDQDNYGTGYTDGSGGARDESMQEVRVFNCYVLMDYEGTGVARRMFVKAAGSGESPTLLPDPDSGEVAIEVDDHPYVQVTPIKQAHVMLGRSLADLTGDIQDIRSTLIRQGLDSIYHANSGRQGISNKVNLDDFLTNRVGGAVRVDTDGADVGGHFYDMRAGTDILSSVMPMWEAMGKVRNERIGSIDPTVLDPHVLNNLISTSMVLGQTGKRNLLMMRTMAETGFRHLGKKLLNIVVNNQDFARVVRLRNQWVPIDPQAWNAEMDCVVDVGLGHGTHMQRVAGLQQIGQLQQSIVTQQGGLNGPFVTADKVGRYLAEFTNAQGFKDEDTFFNTDPDPQQVAQASQKDQGPDPEVQAEMAKTQAQLQIQAMKAKADAELDRQKAQAQAQLDREKAAAELMRKREELAMQAQYEEAKLRAETQAELIKIAATKQVQLEELALEAQLERIKMEIGDPAGQGNIPSPINGGNA